MQRKGWVMGLLLVLVCPSIVLAAPRDSAGGEENSQGGASLVPLSSEFETYDKRIHRGDHEISPEASLGYSSFQGVLLNVDLSYRYFFFDKFSLGPVVGMQVSELRRRYRGGVTGRWYFYESARWAYSLTQDLVYSKEYYRFPGANGDIQSLEGDTKLGAHYFITPNVAFSMTAGARYGLTSAKFESQLPYKGERVELFSRFGLNFNF